MSEKREIPNCWSVMSEKEVADNLRYLLEHYREYDIKFTADGRIYIGNVLSIIPSKQTIIDPFYIVNLRVICSSNKAMKPLNKLVDVCRAEFLTRHNKLTEQYADAKKQIEKMKERETWLIAISATLIMVLISMGVYSVRKQHAQQQVKQREQTLPGYLEQRQAVANYRDSLQRESK